MVLHTANLTKKFGKLMAVDRLNLSVAQGEIFGLLGPNGAGKTTTLSMLATLRSPTSGTATVNGYDILKQKNEVRKSIGMVFQGTSVDDLLTARENLEIHAMLYAVPKEIRKKRIDELLALVELTDRANDLVKHFSGGMKQRLQLVRGLLHHPRVLFLDEPTLGLDPQTRAHVWKYIARVAREEKITIILTTHYMEEADSLCDRIAIIDHGKIAVLGTPASLKKKVGSDMVKFTSAKADAKKLRMLKFVRKIKQDGNSYLVKLDDVSKNLAALLRAAGDVTSVEVRPVNLSDVFMHYTGHEMRDEEEGGGFQGWG
jgi:ABC-2 type transport system ATP-binding protein